MTSVAVLFRVKDASGLLSLTPGRPRRQGSSESKHAPDGHDNHQQSHRGEQGRLAGDLQEQGDHKKDKSPKSEKADDDV